jgi:hypothetical protein
MVYQHVPRAPKEHTQVPAQRRVHHVPRGHTQVVPPRQLARRVPHHVQPPDQMLRFPNRVTQLPVKTHVRIHVIRDTHNRVRTQTIVLYVRSGTEIQAQQVV